MYEISYPEIDSNNLMLEMLPDRMEMKFKDNKYRTELKTAAGIIEMAVVADGPNQMMYNLIKIFSDRFVLPRNKKEAIEMTNALPPFQLTKMNEIDTVAGAVCQKYLLDFGKSENANYTFSATQEIMIDNPNWCTPYYEIPGLLLDYRIENYGMNMHLRAVSIIEEEIDDDEFVIDDRYETLNKKEFDDLIVKNMEIFLE